MDTTITLNLSKPLLKQLQVEVISLLNVASTSTGRATHHNTLEEVLEAEKKAHFLIFSKDRGIYSAIHCLPGMTDHSIQKCISILLGNSIMKFPNSTFTMAQEKLVLEFLSSKLPANRLLNLFIELKDKRVNNTRTRNLILKMLFQHQNLELWSVKYRKKMKGILEHCFGKRMTGIIKSILHKKFTANILTEKESDILSDNILQLIPNRGNRAIQCISFILGNTNDTYTLPLLIEFQQVKTDISKVKNLPIEVVRGISSTYHKQQKIGEKEILEKTSKNLTKTQRMQVQRKAEKLDVEVEFNPSQYSLIELYKYAFNMGLDIEIEKQLDRKAEIISRSFPAKFEKIGILVDDSFSMSGSNEQKFRPISIALSVRDILKKTSSHSEILYTSGRKNETLMFPSQNTDLAIPFIGLLKKNLDAIFIISDGYENTPSGRLNETWYIARKKLKMNIPIYHINPVLASESQTNVRSFDGIPVFPVNNPESIGLLLLRSMIESNIENGILNIINSALKLLK